MTGSDSARHRRSGQVCVGQSPTYVAVPCSSSQIALTELVRSMTSLSRTERWRKRWLISLAGWDGVLPIFVACSTVIVKLVFPARHIAEVVAVTIVPIFAALIRAAIARTQLLAACSGRPGLGRFFALAGAIFLLMLFEFYSGVLQFAHDEPLSAWWIPITIYGLYLGAIVMALRPVACGRNEGRSPID